MPGVLLLMLLLIVIVVTLSRLAYLEKHGRLKRGREAAGVTGYAGGDGGGGCSADGGGSCD